MTMISDFCQQTLSFDHFLQDGYVACITRGGRSDMKKCWLRYKDRNEPEKGENGSLVIPQSCRN